MNGDELDIPVEVRIDNSVPQLVHVLSLAVYNMIRVRECNHLFIVGIRLINRTEITNKQEW